MHASDCALHAMPAEPAGPCDCGFSPLREAIRNALNSTSAENGSNTPDFILASYLSACLAAFDAGVRDPETWHGRNPYGFLPNQGVLTAPTET